MLLTHMEERTWQKKSTFIPYNHVRNLAQADNAILKIRIILYHHLTNEMKLLDQVLLMNTVPTVILG